MNTAKADEDAEVCSAKILGVLRALCGFGLVGS